MSDPRFKQQGFDKKVSLLIEECGEVLAAAGKLQRWGPHSSNPLLPEDQRESNLDWLNREMLDLEQAIEELRVAMIEEDLMPSQDSGKDKDLLHEISSLQRRLWQNQEADGLLEQLLDVVRRS